MRDHEWDARPSLLRDSQELRRKLAHCATVEPCVGRDPEAVEDREQQQWVVRRLSQRFSMFDQKTSPLRSRLRFRRGMSLDLHERRYERDLQLYLLTAQLGRSRQRRKL